MPENTLNQSTTSQVTIEGARAALSRLIECSRLAGRRPEPPDLDVISRVSQEWKAWSDSQRDAQVRCTACRAIEVRGVHASDHYPYCDQHPAYVRLRAVLDALDLAPSTCVALGARQPVIPARPDQLASSLGLRAAKERPPRPYIASSHEVDQALTRLLEHEPRAPRSSDTVEQIALLEEVLLQWAHVHHRDSDPCPFCGAVTSMEEQVQHLFGCEAHPANAATASAQRALEKAVGAIVAGALLELTTYRNRVRDVLQALATSCRIYDGDMGWGDGSAYSEGWSERPWRQDREVAEALLAEGHPPMPVVAPWTHGAEPAPVAAVRADAEQLERALQGLCSACSTFWSGMGDGERGHSIIYDRLFPPWRLARKAAGDALMESQRLGLRLGVAGGRRP